MELVINPSLTNLIKVFNESYKDDYPEDFTKWSLDYFELYYIKTSWFRWELLNALSINDSIEAYVILDPRLISEEGAVYTQALCIKRRPFRYWAANVLLDLIEFRSRELGARKVVIHLRYTSPLRQLLLERGYFITGKWCRMSVKLDRFSPVLRGVKGFTIKPYVDGVDDEVLIKIHNDVFSEEEGFIPLDEERLRMMKSSESWSRTKIYFIQTEEGGTVGLVSYVIKRDGKVLIEAIGIRKGFRGRGLGKYLLNYVLNEIKELGHDLAYLFVTASNKPAMNLYMSTGFRIDYIGLTLTKVVTNAPVITPSLKP